MAVLRDKADRKQLGLAVDRMLFPLSARAPRLTARLLAFTDGHRGGPEKAKQQMLKAITETDRRIVGDWPAEDVVGWEGDRMAAFVNGTDGTVDDYRALGAPDWGFALADVTQGVDVWQGADDTLVPLAHAERLVAELPDAELHVVDGSGHFIPAQPDRLAEVLHTLTTPA
jgi:pimeloyl-ACP methyl ester carboxylesterase